MLINFVCRGNVWRSKVAEAYAKSLLKDNKLIQISSSGIDASRNFDGPVSAYTKQVLERDNLWQYVYPGWLQTTQNIIDEADLLVFLNQDIFDDANVTFKIPKQKILIWNIADRNDSYGRIKECVDQLIEIQIKKCNYSG